MAQKVLADVCEDQECVFCSDNDGEAAFWDEFFYAREMMEEKLDGKKYTVKIVDEESGDEREWKGVRLKKEVDQLD